MHRTRSRRVPSLLLSVLLVAGLLAAAAPTGQANQPDTVKEYLLSRQVDVLQPELEQAMASAGSGDVLHILVQFKGSEVTTEDLAAVTSRGFIALINFEILPIVATGGTRSQIQSLAQSDRVRRIELNQPLPYQLDTSTKTIKADEGVWDRYTRVNGLIGLPIDGSGVTIAVIDSGVDATHPDLELGTKTVANKKFIGQAVLSLNDDIDEEPHGETFPGIGLWVDTPNSDTSSVHGTHVAGIAAGSGAASLEPMNLRGAAPGANIYGLGAGEGLHVFHALAAFDHLYDVIRDGNPLNIRVINNSWGGPGEFDPDSFIHQAVMILSYDMDQYAPPGRRFNQHVVFAGGNVDDDPQCTNSHGRIPVAVSVANTLKDGSGVSAGSCRGVPGQPRTFPDVAAPGTGIFSATNLTRGVLYAGLSGTSMAAPHVAGVIAMMLEANPTLRLAGVADDFSPSAPAHYQDPFFNEITEAEWILKATASRVPGGGNLEPGAGYMPAGTEHGTDDGYGLIDAERAVATAFALRYMRLSNPSATVADALAVADSLILDTVESHPDVDRLEAGWWGRMLSFGVPGAAITWPHQLTVPTTFESLALTIRWRPPVLRPAPDGEVPKPIPSDLNIWMRYPTPGGDVIRSHTDTEDPTLEGSKQVTLTPADIPADTIVGDPAQPWEVLAVTEAGAAVDVDWWMTADLRHAGHWDVGRIDTAGSQFWGDWHHSDHGTGPNHVQSAIGRSQSVEMRYYDLGSEPDLQWARPGAGTAGSSKHSAKANVSDSDRLPTRSVRLTNRAWTAWNQPASNVPPPPTPESSLEIIGETVGRYLETRTLSARLLIDGVPASGRTVDFDLGAQETSGVTNSNGVANATIQLLQPPGIYPLTASFEAPNVTPSSHTVDYEIERQASTLGLTFAQDGSDIILRATLADGEDPDIKLGGRDIGFSRNGTSVGTATTDSNGVATLPVSGPAPDLFSATFAGDAFYLASTAEAEFSPVGAPVITSPSEGQVFADTSVTIEGTAPAGSSVEVLQGTDSILTTLADGDGSWSDTGTFEEGTHTIVATATTTGGNTSQPSDARTFTVDLSVVVGITDAPDPIGDVHVDHVRVAGFATPGSNVTVVLSDGTRSTTPRSSTTNSAGEWSVTGIDATGLANGPITVTATAATSFGSETASITISKETGLLAPRVRIVRDAAGFVDPSAVTITVKHRGPEATGSGDVTLADSQGTAIPVGTITDLPMGSTASFTVDATSLADGSITATGVVESRAGTDTVLIDRLPPIVTIDQPSLVYISLPILNTLVFSGTGHDPGVSGIDRVAVRLGQGSSDRLVFAELTPLDDDALDVTWTADFRSSFLLPGFYTVEAVAFDRSENVSEPDREEILVL